MRSANDFCKQLAKRAADQYSGMKMNKNLIRIAMNQHDDYVLEIQYRDRKKKLTSRVISPIRFVGKDRFLALCLCREEPRMFCLDFCENVQLKPAWDYVMPVAMEELAV